MDYTRKKGGKVIGSGGEACIFRPALKCSNKKTRASGISKLSYSRVIANQWQLLQNIKKKLSVIPNYLDYFLLNNLSTCQPNKLTLKDAANLEKCKRLFFDSNSNNYTDDMNNHLNQYKIINMPYGGRDLSKIISSNTLPFHTINLLLQKLLINAIVPMNKLHINHFDIKPNNILYKNNKLKIIDFGSMNVMKNNYTFIGIEYNHPFCRILFSRFFMTKLSSHFVKYNITPKTTIQKKKLIIKNIYLEMINLPEIASWNVYTIYLQNTLFPKVLKHFVNIDTINFNQVFIDAIVDHCFEVINIWFDYKTMTFNYQKFFKQIYSINSDIYAFIMCYSDIVGDDLNYSNHLKIELSKIILKYCLLPTYAAKPIPIKQLLNELKQLPTN